MIENPSPLQQARIFAFLGKTGGKLAYLVFDSSFLSGAVFGGGVVSPGLTAPPGPGTEGCGGDRPPRFIVHSLNLSSAVRLQLGLLR